jgi:formate dehydrogenase alpha subunit
MGTDVALLNGIMNVILENGWQDQEYIDEQHRKLRSLSKSRRELHPGKG